MESICCDSKPLVSILVPIYNSEKYIERCSASLFEQTYDKIEYIFADDKSTDNSISVLQKFLEKYPTRKCFVQILQNENNQGIAVNRNKLVAAAKGEFLMFVDSDDWIELNTVDLLIQKQLKTNADIVYGQMVIHHSKSDEDAIEPQYEDRNAMALHYTQLTIDHSMCKRIIRKSLFEKNNLRWHEGWNHGEDHYMMPQLCWVASKVERIDNIIYHYDRMKPYSGKPDFSVVYKNWQNELDIISFLSSFFADKDSRIVESLKETKVRYLIGCLGVAYSYRKRKKYNAIASMLYSMPEQYLSKAWFSNADERLICRFYESRVLNRLRYKLLSRTFSLFRVKY